MRILRLVALVTGVVYLTWRLVFTWQDANPVMFFLLLSAEAFGFVRLLMESSMLGSVRPAVRTPEKTMAPDAGVIVVVTDEPTSEVRAAVLSARLISGYQDLLIVDRDDRPDVAALANRLGIERVAGGVHADLGELIDVAMERCTSLFTLLMPADLVVMPDVLEVTAAAFADPDVATVVCRVENTNATDPVGHGGYGDDRQRDELMVSTLDDAGALPWWPGMAVVRRSAISEIDGMSRGRQGVTLATGVRLQTAGWRITDVPVVVGRRLAPWSDDRHLHRWARDLHERLAVLVDKEANHRHTNASRLSRRVYRAADLHVGRAIQRLVLIGLVFVVLFSSSVPLVADPRILVPLWGAWMGSSVLLRWSAQRPIGFQPWITNDLRLLTTDLAVALRALPGKALDAELIDQAPGRAARRAFLTGLQGALVIALAVFGLGILRPSQGDFVVLTTLACVGWLFVMTMQARSGTKLHQLRQNFRASEELRVLASDTGMGLVGVSPFGLDVISIRPLEVGEIVRIAFALPQIDGSIRRFECPTAVRRSSRHGRHHAAYLRFAQLTDAEVDRITEYCAVVAGHQALRDPATDEEVASPIEGTVIDDPVEEPANGEDTAPIEVAERS